MIVATAFAIAMVLKYERRQPASAPAVSLFGLIEQIRNGHGGVDIALANLLCATGLPGTSDLKPDESAAVIDRWADRVQAETNRHMYRFRQSPAEFENSEAYFRALMLIVVLQQDLGVHYNPLRIDQPDYRNPKDLFIHGMIGDLNGGTCASMPVLYVAVGRRLGYPMKLVLTKGHVFARWDAPNEANPSLRGRFNIEGTNHGLETPSDDEYKTWPYELTQAETDNGWYLRSLEPEEELALFLMQRGHCQEDNGLLADAQVSYSLAHMLAPRSPEALGYLQSAVRSESSVPTHASSTAVQDFADQSLHVQREWSEAHVQDVLQKQAHPPQRSPALQTLDSPRVQGSAVAPRSVIQH